GGARWSGSSRRLRRVLQRGSGRRRPRPPGPLLRRHAATTQRPQGVLAARDRRRLGGRFRPAGGRGLDCRSRSRAGGGDRRRGRSAPRPEGERPRLARGCHCLRCRRRCLALHAV
ncbi:MAG: hypothetical protein AVDCRST_MAG12-1820, partial [uncultured Rubrobacteraceae bacterium]